MGAGRAGRHRTPRNAAEQVGRFRDRNRFHDGVYPVSRARRARSHWPTRCGTAWAGRCSAVASTARDASRIALTAAWSGSITPRHRRPELPFGDQGSGNGRERGRLGNGRVRQQKADLRRGARRTEPRLRGLTFELTPRGGAPGRRSPEERQARPASADPEVTSSVSAESALDPGQRRKRTPIYADEARTA